MVSTTPTGPALSPKLTPFMYFEDGKKAILDLVTAEDDTAIGSPFADYFSGGLGDDTVSGKEGTSFASPAAAGAGAVVRDYFAQGNYPDGTSSNPGNDGDLVPNISGALVKAVLISSAEWLVGFGPNFQGAVPGGDWLTYNYRFNVEQGYGRIKLDNALPLQSWPASVSGLAVYDGGIDGAYGPRTRQALGGVEDATEILVAAHDRDLVLAKGQPPVFLFLLCPALCIARQALLSAHPLGCHAPHAFVYMSVD